MADQGFPPVPPVPPDVPPAPPTAPQAPAGQPAPPAAPPMAPHGVPPAGASGYGAPYGYGYGQYPGAPAQPPKRSRAWMWWTIGILALLTVIVVSCSLPFALLFSGDGIDGAGAFGDSVAVIRVDGVIAGTGDYYSGYITPEYFLDRLKRAVEDENVKAIVLRVDSPGGTVAASEEIAEYVRTCKKPIIVSIGDVGASGAYMISSQADQIWANPGSSVGSIGVIAEIPNASELLDKVGVEFQVITAGKNKDTGSPFRPLKKEERALIQGEVNEAYDQFIDIVAKGRKMDRSEVESLATGWTWSGEKAKQLKLIDEIGTYQQALDAAAKRGGIKGDYEVVNYDDEFEQFLGPLLGIKSSLDLLSQQAGASRESAVRRSVPR